MKSSILRSCMLLTVTLAVLSGCSSHCTCPPPQSATPSTTIIHEPSNSNY